MRFILALSIAMVGCASVADREGESRLSYQLAHNTERTLIATETAAVLQLYDFTIEYNDPGRQRGMLQTLWRTVTKPVDREDPVGSYRDRARLNITRRGRSSVVYNVYFMVNASIEFECQMRDDATSTWKSCDPPEFLRKQYETIVKDIRNRMMKYDAEFSP